MHKCKIYRYTKCKSAKQKLAAKPRQSAQAPALAANIAWPAINVNNPIPYTINQKIEMFVNEVMPYFRGLHFTHLMVIWLIHISK